MRVDPNYVNGLVAAIDRSSAREDALSAELSSGSRLATIADDPNAIAQSTLINSAVTRDDTFVQNAAREQSMLQVTDTTLGEVVSQVTSAVSLAVKGATGTLNTANREAVAAQLTTIRDRVLSLGNSRYLGQYVFAGSQGGAPPFALDSSVTPAAATYTGDTSVQTITTPNGQKIPLNLPGGGVFTAPGANLLQALNGLIADFSGGAVGAATAADSAALSDALGVVSQQRSIVGSSLNALATVSTATQTEETQYKARQSQLVAADTAQVASDLRTAETQHQALLSVMGVLSKGSLFDYIH